MEKLRFWIRYSIINAVTKPRPTDLVHSEDVVTFSRLFTRAYRPYLKHAYDSWQRRRSSQLKKCHFNIKQIDWLIYHTLSDLDALRLVTYKRSSKLTINKN